MAKPLEPMVKPLDMNSMQRSSRDARDEAEATALAKVDGKKRLRKNRTEAMTIRLSPQRRAQLERLSDALGVRLHRYHRAGARCAGSQAERGKQVTDLITGGGTRMTNHLPLVLQLRADAVDPNVPVSKLLRLAKVIATKLDQKDALKWIDKELDGYMDGVTKEVPAYRMIGGQPKGYNPYHGWQTIQFQDDETAKAFSRVPLGQSIGSIEKDLGNKERRRGAFVFPYPSEVANALREAIRLRVEVTLFLSDGSLWGVVEAVRNLVLNWILELEKAGILGAEMTFTPKEKEQGAAVTQQYFIQNVGVIGNVSDSAKVENTQTATAALDAGKIGDFAQEALVLMGQLPADLRPKLAPMLIELRKEAAKEKPNQSTLREMLTSVRTIAEGAAGNLAASGIVAMISKLLGV